ncbi:EAL domain-containing protein, partial [Pseudomonas otitidis]
DQPVAGLVAEGIVGVAEVVQVEVAEGQAGAAVFHQPRLCLKTGRIVGLEALVRWRHAERGLLAPSEFVPL